MPWGIGDVRLRGDIRGYEPGEYSVFYEQASGAVTVYHRPSATMVFWVIDPRLSPWYERGAPLRSALHHWAAGQGMHFVHAGAVGVDGRGVLLAGASGSGKSTTALACLDAGLQYAGDDYVILTPEDAPRVHCLYSTAKLDAPSLERLPGLAAAVADFRRGEEQKAVIDVHGHRPGLVVDSLAIDAVVIPSVGARRAATAPPGEVLARPARHRTDDAAPAPGGRRSPGWRRWRTSSAASRPSSSSSAAT